MRLTEATRDYTPSEYRGRPTTPPLPPPGRYGEYPPRNGAAEPPANRYRYAVLRRKTHALTFYFTGVALKVPLLDLLVLLTDQLDTLMIVFLMQHLIPQQRMGAQLAHTQAMAILLGLQDHRPALGEVLGIGTTLLVMSPTQAIQDEHKTAKDACIVFYGLVPTI